MICIIASDLTEYFMVCVMCKADLSMVPVLTQQFDDAAQQDPAFEQRQEQGSVVERMEGISVLVFVGVCQVQQVLLQDILAACEQALAPPPAPSAEEAKEGDAPPQQPLQAGSA
eukprot:5279223-Amphidinium_carterae.1